MTASPFSSIPATPSWAKFIRLLGGVILLGAVVYWASAGAHRGWSQNRVPLKKIDEITGIEYVHYEDRFVPGIDVVAGGVAVGGTLLLLPFLFRRKRS